MWVLWGNDWFFEKIVEWIVGIGWEVINFSKLRFFVINIYF